jgi:hypothetical protein
MSIMQQSNSAQERTEGNSPTLDKVWAGHLAGKAKDVQDVA